MERSAASLFLARSIVVSGERKSSHDNDGQWAGPTYKDQVVGRARNEETREETLYEKRSQLLPERKRFRSDGYYLFEIQLAIFTPAREITWLLTSYNPSLYPRPRARDDQWKAAIGLS